MSQSSSGNVNDEIESIRPYKFRPFLLHFNIGPFFAAYLVWFAVWTLHLGVDEYPEIGLIITAFIAIAQVVTCLFCYWFVEFRCFMNCTRVDNPEFAEVVQVTPTANNGFAELVYLHRKYNLEEDNLFNLPSKVIYFQFQKTKYILDTKEKKQFLPIEFPVNHSIDFYINEKGYNMDKQVTDATSYYDMNKMVMDIPKFLELFIERATAPFFVFQVFCVLLWCLDEYWYYSLFTLFMLVSFECTLVQQQLKNMQMIRQMGNKPFKILVYRMRKWVRINSDELLPGDICSVSRNLGKTGQNDNSLLSTCNQTFSLPCDMILLRGQCVVNESMLTGESVPVIKESIESRNDHSNMFDVQADSKLHVLSGGTIIVQHTGPSKSDNSGLRSPDNGCVAYVLRTGFNTSQGKLLRTIMFSVKQVTANNLETFMFIVFLLIFAVAASAYVWIEGSKDPSRNRYKLFLECALILTSVIPPELPIELALAVNTSLLSLVKLGIYCTEPFRIPFAGKIDICCFDKTGTLTSDDLIVEGVAGIDNKLEITQIQNIPVETLYTIGTCHTLINLEDELIGDPLEKVALQAIEWGLTKGDVCIAKKRSASSIGWKIYQRFHFSSALKRMSVIAGHTKPGHTDISYIATCKGAPEILRNMIEDLPDQFDEIYLHYAREGSRVLCLAYKELGQLSHQQIRDFSREEVENKLKFAGFIVISCPLKSDSKAVIKEILHSSHHITMITGDNPLTACHVANELKMINKKHALVLTKLENDKWVWQSTINENRNLEYPLTQKTFPKWSKNSQHTGDFYNYLCLTGEGFDYMFKNEHDLLKRVLSEVKVFARTSPKQKEWVITMLKSLGYVTLMCGDGTNDVGALKHANVGVALLSNTTANVEKTAEYEQAKKAKITEAQLLNTEVKSVSRQQANQQSLTNAQKKLNDCLKELEEAEQAHIVKLGDASIASPFTYKQSSIQCVCHIIKQGRCTLVTTLQMFKILALNALILAYSQSVLYLDGIKLSDGQATMQGLLLAGCFLFISRSKPLKNLSKTRPLPNIFNFYTIITVLAQFSIHLSCLIYLVSEAHSRSPPKEEQFVKLDSEFKPSLVNSTVYIISLSLQVATFAINYKGHPFMESLSENKPLLYSIIFSASSVWVLACRLVPELSDQFQIVEFPDEFRNILVTVILSDFCASYIIDRVLEYCFGKASLKKA